MFSSSKSVRDPKLAKPASFETRPIAPAAKPAPDVVSTFGPGMVMTGNIVCTGALQIYGRVTGDIQAAHLVISEDAKVEGKISAPEVVIEGSFSGTIHANGVKLLGRAVVDGEVYNKSLTIEQNVQFEGVSRRLDRPVEAPTGEPIEGTAAPSLAPTAPVVAESETVG